MDQSVNLNSHGDMEIKKAPVLDQGFGILLIDSRMNPYLFVSKLAQGAQGVAQICWDIKHQRYVVRKRSLMWIGDQRAARPDREVTIAREIQRLQEHLPSGLEAAFYDFARVISNGNLSIRHWPTRFYRESYWKFYNGGGTFDNLLIFFGERTRRPHALVLNLTHSVLSALQWINSLNLYHLDAHLGNVFLRWDESGQIRPVIGDFGYARFAPPLESPFNGNWEDRRNSEVEARNLSSPPGDYTVRDPIERLPLDFVAFVHALRQTLQEEFRPEKPPRHQLMFEVIRALDVVGQRERQNDAISSDDFVAHLDHELRTFFSPSEHSGNSGDSTYPSDPPRVDITPLIADIKAAEQSYLDDGGDIDNQAALVAWREHTRRAADNPAFPTRGDAQVCAERMIQELGPYAVVSFAHPASIQVGVDLLAIETGYDGGKQCDVVEEGEELQQEEESPQQLAENWFNDVFIPAVSIQYVEKWKARDRNQPWDARTLFGVAGFSPGPNGLDLKAIREWLITVARPRFGALVEQRT